MLSPVLLSEKLWIALVSTVLFPLSTKTQRCVETLIGPHLSCVAPLLADATTFVWEHQTLSTGVNAGKSRTVLPVVPGRWFVRI